MKRRDDDDDIVERDKSNKNADEASENEARREKWN